MRREGFDMRVCALLLAATLATVGCPGQELAALNPCTVSSASIRVDQGGVSDVDLLFVIDNSISMASEQLKIANELPRLVSVLTSGDRYFGRDDQVPADITDKQRYFTKASSLHIGVVSSSMRVMDDLPSRAPVGLVACRDGDDDAKLRSSTEVAANGISVDDVELVAGSAACAGLDTQPRYQTFEAGTDDNADDVAEAFSCVSRLGVEGCPFEQQLEAMWKAVSPSDGEDPSLHVFLDDTRGHGSPDGFNKGFVRDDAILAVIQVSDEEDCSIKQEGKELFSYGDEASQRFEPPSKINLRCGKYGDAEGLLWPAERYVEGLKSLKPNNPDRVIFAAIVGIPVDAIGQPLDDVLARDEMQFALDPANSDLPRASCSTPSVAGSKPDQAYPPRRFLEVAKGFGPDAVVYSICADDYAPALNTLIDRIADKLEGNCLPRQLTPDQDGLVRCEVFELLSPKETECTKARGHKGKAVERSIKEQGNVELRLTCLMEQVPVLDKTPKAGVTGWYYDDFSEDLAEACQPGNRQRVQFSFGTLPPDASAIIECFQPVARIDPNASGLDAVNTRCGGEEDVCATRSNGSDGGYDLICVENTCQITCKSNPDCPPAWLCARREGDTSGPKYCQQPTCPSDDTTRNAQSTADD